MIWLEFIGDLLQEDIVFYSLCLVIDIIIMTYSTNANNKTKYFVPLLLIIDGVCWVLILASIGQYPFGMIALMTIPTIIVLLILYLIRYLRKIFLSNK